MSLYIGPIDFVVPAALVTRHCNQCRPITVAQLASYRENFQNWFIS
jgi:hypothetical protein